MTSAAAPSTEQFAPGTVVGDRFEVVDLLGEGAMGQVYRAKDRGAGGMAALKVLHKHLTDSREYRGRFKREARAASRFRHDSAVRVLASGLTDDSIPYIAMELVEGRSLKEIIAADAPLSQGRAMNIANQLLRALAAAHRHGIVHRDMKPDNIRVVVDEDGIERPKILDFGVAKFIAGDVGEVTGGLKTKTGVILGTPKYMSPEQIRGETIDGRADIYAVGAMLREMITGEPPFTADDVFGFVTKHLKEQVRSITEAYPRIDVSPEVDEIILRMLEKDPKDRPSDADTLADEVEPWAIEDPRLAEKGRMLKRGLMAVGAGGVVGAGIALVAAPSIGAAAAAGAVGLAAGAAIAAARLPRPSVRNFVRRIGLVACVVLVAELAAYFVAGSDGFVAAGSGFAATLCYAGYMLVWNARGVWLRPVVAGVASPLFAALLFPVRVTWEAAGDPPEVVEKYLWCFEDPANATEQIAQLVATARHESLLGVVLVSLAFGLASVALPRPGAARL